MKRVSLIGAGLLIAGMTISSTAFAQGVRFETDEKRQVYVIHAGTAAIQYIEGCA